MHYCKPIYGISTLECAKFSKLRMRVRLRHVNVKKMVYIRNDVHVFYLFFFKVLCFSACSTIFSSTGRPFLFRTVFIYLLAIFSESAFSPKCSNSSSVEGTQKGSLEINCEERTTTSIPACYDLNKIAKQAVQTMYSLTSQLAVQTMYSLTSQWLNTS